MFKAKFRQAGQEVCDMARKGAGGKRGRSAVTGRFVKQSSVKRSPRTTVNESTKRSR